MISHHLTINLLLSYNLLITISNDNSFGCIGSTFAIYFVHSARSRHCGSRYTSDTAGHIIRIDLHTHLTAVISYSGMECRCMTVGWIVVLVDTDDIKGARLQHTVETTLPCSDSEHMGSIIPTELNGGALALLVVVVVTFILIEGK